MADLDALLIFAKVVEANGFSKAARLLKMPTSTVSRRVADLERQLGVRLLERSTRALRLTGVGAEVYEHAQRSAELSDAVDAVVSNRVATVTGRLRLSAPPSLSERLIAPLVGAFQAAHPDVRVELFVTDRFVDPIVEGIDVVFRRGALEDSTLVARTALTYRHRLVASPAYLERHEAPKSPRDLLSHRLLAFSHRTPKSKWTFVHPNGKERETLAFDPYLAMNDFAGLVPALLDGVGIGELPPLVQPELVRDRRLVEVMPKWRFRTLDLSVVHIGLRQVQRPVRLFAQLAVELLPKLFPNLPI
jgi:DNA-binding transcriptional LysR family regulator